MTHSASSAAAGRVIPLVGSITYPAELDWFFQGHFVDKGENVLLFGGPASGKYNMCRRTVASNLAERCKSAFFAVCADQPYRDIWAYPGHVVGQDGALVEQVSPIPGVDPRMIDCDMLVLDGLPLENTDAHNMCGELLALRTRLGRSTVVLVTSWQVDAGILDKRYAGKLEPRTWHVLNIPAPPPAEH